MEGNRLFYTLKLCDATNCANNHVSMVEKIEKNIIDNFNYQLSANNLTPFVSTGPTYLAQATHIQYIDTNDIIHIHARATGKQLTPNIINFRLQAISPWATFLGGAFEPYEVKFGGLLVAYNNHLIK